MSKKQDTLMKHIDGETHFPYRFENVEKKAQEVLPKEAFDYIQSGAGREETLSNNRTSLEQVKIVPRMLQNVGNIDLSVKLFGNTYKQPVFLAPIGMQKLAHPEAELATVRAAKKHGVPMIVSTASTFSLEEIAKEVPDHPLWYQIYWNERHPDVSINMAVRAEQAGYDAIVVTVDTVLIGWRERDLENQFSPLKAGYGLANFKNDEAFMSHLDGTDDDTIVRGIVENFAHPTLNWKDIEKIKKATGLPVIVKGILDPEDARFALEHGVDGIIVSNHGGRQLDGVIGSAEALPTIVEEINGQIPVLFDGGIRRGADVVKALALGADAVLVGRPFMYGLAIDGENGVSNVLEHLLSDLHVSAGLAGSPDVRTLKALKTRK
ncbi:alpha-hydroxy acid oxidase [Aciduricibacillus chroicocephali]|uniref:L-lactate oxidase n=1 Tax=Aciduricibacillus chroicocephali TaxID=3054939 RepID=A0ABY9KV37_9BACI|nr:alpha-hydroxy acid oxidase [Bacillaceae bacterium 44XB]